MIWARRLLVALAFAGVLFAGGQSAHAQDAPPPEIPPGCPGGPPLLPPLAPVVCPPQIGDPLPPPAGSPNPGGDSMVPDPELPGKHPTRNYDIGFDSGAWNSLYRKSMGFLTELGWMLNRLIVSWSLWLVKWAFSFGIEGALSAPVIAIASAYHADLVGPFGPAELCWTYLGTWCGFQYFRGRPLTAAGELLMSIVVFGCSVLMMANLSGYLSGAQNTMNQMAGAVVALGSGQPPNADPASTAQLVDPLRSRLHEVFIEHPHDIINWGHPLAGDCAAVRDQLLSEGSWGDSDEPRDRMKDAGCQAEADFNHDPTSERLIGAWMTTFVSVVVLVLMVFVAFTVLVAKFFGMIAFAVAPFAFVGGVLPGAGREILWAWLSWLLRILAVVVGMAWLLSLLLLASGALLTLPGVSLQERFGFLLVIVVGMFMMRRHVIGVGAHLASRARTSLSGVRFGSGQRAGYGGWTPQPAGGGFTGFGIGANARATVQELPGNRAYSASHSGRMSRYQHGNDRLRSQLLKEQIRETKTRRHVVGRMSS